MADDIDENFEISDEFIPEPRPLDYEEEDESNAQDSGSKKKRKRKNITEILELRKNQLAKPSFAVNEFTKLVNDHAVKKLSIVERNGLNLGGDISERLDKMMLKRKNTHQLDVGLQFRKKLVKKLRVRKQTKSANGDQRSPFIIVLAQSAVRCIELHKKISDSKLMKSLKWIYAFARHKKLNEQISFINSKFERDPNHSLDIVYATPQRLQQLFDAGCLTPNSTQFVFIDYSFRDIKLKRMVDHEAIRADLCQLLFRYILPVNRDNIGLKFYLA